MSSEKEPCSGCGAMSAAHPMVGIALDENGQFAAFPVCEACWRDPAHRLVTLKMHFFPAAQATVALSKAGSTEIG